MQGVMDTANSGAVAPQGNPPIGSQMSNEELAAANDDSLVEMLYSKHTPREVAERIQEELNSRATVRLCTYWERFREENATEIGSGKNKRKRLLTQKEFVEQYINPRFNTKWKQSNFSQYLNGTMIGPRPMTIFCTMFGVMPGDIRKELGRSGEKQGLGPKVIELKQTLEDTIAKIKDSDEGMDPGLGKIRMG